MSQEAISDTRSTPPTGRTCRQDRVYRAGPFRLLSYTFASLGMSNLSTSCHLVAVSSYLMCCLIACPMCFHARLSPGGYAPDRTSACRLLWGRHSEYSALAADIPRGPVVEVACGYIVNRPRIDLRPSQGYSQGSRVSTSQVDNVSIRANMLYSVERRRHSPATSSLQMLLPASSSPDTPYHYQQPSTRYHHALADYKSQSLAYAMTINPAEVNVSRAPPSQEVEFDSLMTSDEPEKEEQGTLYDPLESTL